MKSLVINVKSWLHRQAKFTKQKKVMLMINEELVSAIEKQIIRTLIDSLYKVNRITKREYNNIITELSSI